ncbi:palmitoyl acyltransferase 4 [Novymonas esmeraldas]|uniref:Palmitoyltransferase n=1 Tax=Novymonas esmeraldas TaxID=1808958 RepID=A0AAW0ELZ8_9TRYP
MSLSAHRPVPGTMYGVVCPVCCNPMDFKCTSEAMYGARCPTCSAMIDLRRPTETLADTDTGVYDGDGSSSGGGGGGKASPAVYYAGDVEPSTGLSASAQVHHVVRAVEAEKRKVMPAQMTSETKQAFSAQRNQALSEKFSFFFPVTHAIEYLVFGSTPYAKIGHVRIFRKRVPFYGYVNIGAPRTTTSYAAPCTFTFVSFVLFNWFCAHMELEWVAPYYYLEWLLVVLFYGLLFRLAYSDPGYVKPAYMDDEGGDTAAAAAGDMTLRDIESNQRASLWETVDGVPMERKWCSTCNMHRPLRAAHCYICGLCCYDHDHHCSVIGVCVGRRRVEMFSMFVTVAASACVVPTMVVLCGWWTHPEKITTLLHTIGCALIVVPLGLFSLFLYFTAFSMWQSITQGTSTRERIQNVYAQKRNPYDRGFFGNLYYHLVQRTVAPSLFDDAFVKRCATRTQERELGTGITVTCV